MMVGMHWRFAAQRCSRKLAAAVGNDFVYIHVELRAASGHPHVQRKHVLMLAGKNLVADLDNQAVLFVIEPSASMIRVGGGFLQNCVRCNHLAGNQVLTDTEVLKRALCLSAPEFVGGHPDLA